MCVHIHHVSVPAVKSGNAQIKFELFVAMHEFLFQKIYV